MTSAFINSIIFNVCALMFILFLFVIFIIKRKFSITNNNNLAYLIASSFLLIILEFVIQYLTIYTTNAGNIIAILCRTYNFIICMFITFLLMLLLKEISNVDEEIKNKYGKYKIFILGVGTLLSLAIAILVRFETNYIPDLGTYKNDSNASIFVYSYNSIFAIACVYYAIKYRKKISSDISVALSISFVYYVIYIITVFTCSETYNAIPLIYTSVIYALYLTFENQELQIINNYKQLNEELVKSSSEKNSYLLDMSKNIRGPLSSILGFSKLLKDKNLSEDKKQEYIKNVKESSLRLSMVINELNNKPEVKDGEK